MKNFKRLYLYSSLFLIIICYNSCATIVQMAFGIKSPRVESITEQKKTLKKWDIDTSQLFFVKRSFILTNKFKDVKYALDTFTNQGFTPIQFRVYDKNQNFYTGWELCIGSLKQYSFFTEDTITKINHKALNYSINLKNDVNFITDNPDSLYNFIKNEKFDYVIVAMWSGWLGSFSKDMLKEIDRFYKTTSKKVLFLKVNLSVDKEMREKMEGA